MTWYYDIADDGSSMEIIDHNQTVVKTLQNDGSGFTIPEEIKSAMREEAEVARDNNNTERWRDIHIRLADDDLSPKE